MSYAIASSELTLTDKKNFRAAAVDAGAKEAIARGIAKTTTELVARAAMPFTDFFAAAVGWSVQEWYRGPAIAAVGWGSVFNTGAVPANVPMLARTKIAIFYGFTDYSANPVINGVRFRLGAQGASTLATFFFQDVRGKLEPDVYFSEPVVYGPEDMVYIEAHYNAIVGAAVEQFAFMAYILERTGPTIS